MSSKKVILLTVVVGILISATLAVFLLRTSAHREVGNAQPDNAQPSNTQAGEGTRVLSPEPETIERPLPETQLTDLEGQQIPSDELRRGSYLLIFMTTGCSPCIDEANAVSRLVRDSPSSVRVYGVGVERPAQVAAFVKKFDLKFPFLLDKESGLRQSLDVRRFPTKFLVENGIIKKAWYGKTPDEARLRGQLALVEVK